MARKKLTLNEFKKFELGLREQRSVKGGYKAGPSGASNISSLIWESVDVREPQGPNRGDNPGNSRVSR